MRRVLAGFVRASVVLVLVAGLGGVLAPGAAGLPDGRAYELVSAADKAGGDVISDSARVRVADDGGAVSYASLTTFGDAIGGGIATEYMAVRDAAPGAQGWVTHAISPPQPALSFTALVNGFEARYEQDLSPDLNAGVVFAWRPLSSNPYVANVANLYLRSDLRTPGAGSYALLTGCPVCIGPFATSRLSVAPQFIASTPDFRHLLFETALNLTPGPTGGGIKLYEWDADLAGGPSQGVSLIGVLPDGTPAADSAAGVGHGQFQHRNAISADARKVFFMATQNGVQNVYMRLNETSTLQLNSNEATVADSPQPAQYWAAASDGSRVFFTTTQALTDNAPHDGAIKLYMYDTTKPDSDPHNLTLINVPTNPNAGSNVVNGVVGASADGHTVYFYDATQLLAGQPPLRSVAGMYAWHDGQLSFVANLYGGDQETLPDNSLIFKTARVSRSGDLVFLSTEPIAPNGQPHGNCPGDTPGGCAQVYVYNIEAPPAVRLRCASCSPSGAPASTDAQTNIVDGAGGSNVTNHLSRVITDDGRRVFFMTREALLPQDVNGKIDVYEYDTSTGTLSLISSGQSAGDSYLMETTPTGDDVFFTTREQLTGWDQDANYDLYDARVHGAIPDPTPPPAACSGESCRPPLITAPPISTPASATVTSTGNLLQHLKPRTKTPPKCKHGLIRKKTKHTTHCVKPPTHATRRSTITRRSR